MRDLARSRSVATNAKLDPDQIVDVALVTDKAMATLHEALQTAQIDPLGA